MRFFHLSDLHFGLRLNQKSLAEDQAFLGREIAKLAKERRPDAIVLAGDLFDRSDPPADAVRLFDDFLIALREAAPEAPILAISGNHDSAQRVNLYREFLAREQVYMIGLPPASREEKLAQVTLADEFGPVHFYLMPFVKPAMVQPVVQEEGEETRLSYDEAVRRLLAREELATDERNVLVSHQFYVPHGTQAEDAPRAASEIRAVGNVDAVRADVLAPFDYVALGHIHREWQWDGGRVRYCGAPLATSFTEADTQKHLTEVTLGAMGSVHIEKVPLAPLHPVRILKGTVAELLAKSSLGYVRLVVAQTEGLLTPDVQDRLRTAFPNLIEVQREGTREQHADELAPEAEERDPLALVEAFLGGMTEEEERVLTEILNEAEEAEA